MVCGATSEFILMAIVIRICVFLMHFGIADTREWKPETFAQGENVTIRMDGLHINGTQNLQIKFAGFISNQHVSNVMLYNPKRSDKISVNINYTGRIERFEMNKSSLSFLLLNVKFMDSGTYTILRMEDSVVKVETSILVARQMLVGHQGDSMNITFMCNKTNISSIKIGMMLSQINFPVAIYDVSHANCTEFGYFLKNRIEICLFNGITFSLTIRSVRWLDSGTYVAWDDMNYLLDSIFVYIEDTKRTSLETSKGYVTLPSTVNGPTDSSKFAKGNESKELSSTERPHGYFNSSFVTNTASSDGGNEVWLRLLFAAVGVAVTVPLTVAITLLILWRRGSFQFTCIGPEQALKMGPISRNTTESNAADEREYEEPCSITTDLSIYLEPIGIITVHTEDNNPSGSCIKEYEKLHPYENQGNNTYSSLRAEYILENE